MFATQQADRAQQQTASRGNQSSLFDAVLCERGAGATGGEEKGGRSRRATLAAGTHSSSAFFPFASAATGATNAARKLEVGTAVERRRLEREAFRVSVHEYIRRELVKASIENSRVLAAMADVE